MSQHPTSSVALTYGSASSDEDAETLHVPSGCDAPLEDADCQHILRTGLVVRTVFGLDPAVALRRVSDRFLSSSPAERQDLRGLDPFELAMEHAFSDQPSASQVQSWRDAYEAMEQHPLWDVEPVTGTPTF